jgi:hypothetical protein
MRVRASNYFCSRRTCSGLRLAEDSSSPRPREELSMLALTDAAAEAIKGVVPRRARREGAALRIAAAPEGAPEGRRTHTGVRHGIGSTDRTGRGVGWGRFAR